MQRVVRLCFVLLLFASVVAFAAKEFVMPKVYPAKTYPAHDDHPMERFSIAADPYDMADKAAVFTIDYRSKGYLPIFVVFTNDGDQPVAMNEMKVQLITRNRDKIQPADEDDLYRRFSKIRRRGDEARRNPLPIPLPGGGPDVGVKKNSRDEIGMALFSAKAVAPGESQAGFMFFDVSGISQPLAGARLFFTGLTNHEGQELMYFEIPMEKYLSYTPPGTEQR
ncbi:MAG TPA: hypothetical protein VN577_10235 [Terriglobales bacterium]|nr:hypothetical protein [Terriglobales bacterium]